MWLMQLLRSFRFALEGLRFTLMTQRNMRIHFLVTLAVLFLGLYLPISKFEVLVLMVAISLVLFAELINTAVEAVIDLVTEEYHPLAKIAKDVAAGAVFLTAGLAVIVGISVFYPYLDSMFNQVIAVSHTQPKMGLAIIVVIDFFMTLLLKGWIHRKGWIRFEPSMTASIALCTGTILIWVMGNLTISLLVALMMTMLVLTRLNFTEQRIPVLCGSVLGLLVAIVGLQLI